MRKKILAALLIILSITQTVIIPQKIYAEEDHMQLNDYVKGLEKLEKYAKKYGGNINDNVWNYIQGKSNEFSDLCNEKDETLHELQNVEHVDTNVGTVNVKQLLKGCINQSARKDYKKYAGYVESEEFYTAMDEYLITGNDLVKSIKKYYRGLTQERRIKRFADDFYRIKSSNYDEMKLQIQKINKNYGIRTTDSLINFFYNNYPAQKMSYFTIGGRNYVDIGGTTVLDIRIFPENAKYGAVKYRSSDPKIATVDDHGIVYGKKKGEFTVYIVIGDQESKMEMKCIVPINEISDQTKETEILVGKTVKMKTKISPKDATMQHLQYTTSDPNIATVDKDGKVKAVGPGYAYITAKAYNGEKIVHKFRCYQKIQRIESEEKKTLIVGKSERVNYQVFPLGFTDNKIKFSSDNPDIVSVDDKGMMYPKKNGTAQIIISSKNAADIYSVTNVTVITKMKDIVPDKWQSYYMGHPQKFRYDTDPITTSNKKLKYSMKKNEYAEIQSDGTIIPKKIGQTELTVRSTDGTKLSKKLTIYIEQMVEKITIKKNIYLKKGEKFHVYYTISPVNATKKAITIKSGDTDRVKVDGESVIATGYGKTKMTIESKDPGHKSATFYVIVKRPMWHYLLAAGIGILLVVGMVEVLKKDWKKKK